jgi:predicted alpha/beta-fold hydrolase
LPDGDGLVLYDAIPDAWCPGDRIAVMVHGLTGSHASGQVQRLGRRFLARGVRVVRLDLRGTGKGLHLARGYYNGGCSADVRAALEEIQRWSPTSPLLLLGVSLGGNIVLKLAGEAASTATPAIERIMALSPPIDLERCAGLLGQPSNRLYEKFFLRDLITETHQRQRIFPDLPRLRLSLNITMRTFDDLVTAPLGGFASALDYYRRSSSAPLISRIRAPTLIITSRDDPFIAVEPFETLQLPPAVKVRIVSHGGHLGFLGWDGTGGIRWAERHAVDWLVGDGEHSDEGPDASSPSPPYSEARGWE